MEKPQFVAGGDINPSRFIKISTAADNTVLEADANEVPIAISQEGTAAVPIPSASTLAAAAGQQLKYYTEGEVCLLEIADTITRGGNIKSDNDGKGVPALTTGTTEQNHGAVALQSGVSGDKIRVIVRCRSRYPALS